MIPRQPRLAFTEGGAIAGYPAIRRERSLLMTEIRKNRRSRTAGHPIRLASRLLWCSTMLTLRLCKREQSPSTCCRRLPAATTTGGLIAVAVIGVSTAASAAPPDAAQGEKVFAEQKCGLCHSIAGKGNPKGPLDEAVGKLTAADMRAWITDANGMTAKTKATRKPAMKQFALPKDDVDALVAYLSSIKKP
jgi:mono/diheme cytochrome c family protein